jgi:hypothetical protein
MNEPLTKSVKITKVDWDTLREHAEKTGKRMQALLGRAIQRCYGTAPDARKTEEGR